MSTRRNRFLFAAPMLILGAVAGLRSPSATAAEPNTFAPNTSAPSTAPNTLTDQEKSDGWKLLFDGKTTDGWRNYKKKDVSPGWQVVDGTLACVDPKKAGDLITDDKYDAFELLLEYNISPGGNSGVMYHVTEEGPTAWTTGPEVQLFDNNQPAGHEEQHAGWLYQLYKPQNDLATGKPIDATKPAGEWNLLRIVVSPQKSETEMNGVKYYEYVIGSPDWNEHVAKSKFASMEKFGKADTGHIALQGDHGKVSFRNIKIRPLK